MRLTRVHGGFATPCLNDIEQTLPKRRARELNEYRIAQNIFDHVLLLREDG
jgi:hypothetical protein